MDECCWDREGQGSEISWLPHQSRAYFRLARIEVKMCSIRELLGDMGNLSTSVVRSILQRMARGNNKEVFAPQKYF